MTAVSVEKLPTSYITDEDLLRHALPVFLPPPRLRVSEFADAHLIVPNGPRAGSRWQTSYMPYQTGILDAFFEPGIEIVVLQASSQVGKTSTALVMVAYHAAHDPCPILVVEPTVDPMARDFSKNRLEPIIDATPILRETFSKKRAKDATNTLLQKTFRGGSLSIGGANSAASLAARTIRLLLLDEIDRYPAELPGEGATIQIALKRTAAFRGRRRICMYSSPTMKGAPIDTWFHRGDQRRFYVPCPSCGYKHPYLWKNVIWQGKDPSTARLHCPSCDHAIDDAERVAILQHGEWRPENPARTERSIVSFHLWEAYSPLSSLSEIVSGFLAAMKAKEEEHDASLLHTWINTTLGEPIEPYDGESVKSETLLDRCEDYAGVEAPAGVACLTMGVDVQDDRLEALVIGWGPGEESWLVDRQLLTGDTSKPEPWKMLDDLLVRTYIHASGQRLDIKATCIDSAGHRTDMVYDYAARQAGRRVFAIIGRDGLRPIVSSPSPKRWGRNQRPVALYTIGVDAAKALIVPRLQLPPPGRGAIHFPLADWCDNELAKQLTSERLITKWVKGVPSQEWRQIRARNEALDGFVYALGALRLLHPNLELLAEQLAGIEPPPKPPTPPRRAGWLGEPRSGWLRRNR